MTEAIPMELALLQSAIRRWSRQHPGEPLRGADLIAFNDQHELFGEAQGELSLSGTGPWAVCVVGGELSLRAALLDAAQAVVVHPPGMMLPHDIGQRCWLRRSLPIAAEDVVEAATGFMCQPFTDPGLEQAILSDVKGFFERAQSHSWQGPTIREGQVVQLLRGGKRSTTAGAAHELLARWLVDGPPGSDPMLRVSLRDAHFEVHDWLIDAATEEGLQNLVTAGALGTSHIGRECTSFALPMDAERSWERLTALVRRAMANARRLGPQQVERWLAPAEQLASQLELDFDEASRLTLLRAGFDRAVVALVGELAAGRTRSQQAFDQLHQSQHADEVVIEVLEGLARLSGFVDPAAETPDGAVALAQLHRDEGAWADVCARVVRRDLARLPEASQTAAEQILAAYRARRNQLNRQFAQAVAKDEVSLYGRQAPADGMSLHLITSQVVRPLVEEAPVLLVVLDGCDFAAFYELLTDLRSEARLGLRSPRDLVAALSPLPTLTQVGRRALFGGQIPNNDTLTDQENAGANATNDKAAFKKNTALGDFTRQLFLKGDLSDDAASLLAAIEGDCQVVAVVFNGIDDQLSSRETTLHTHWRADAIHGALRRALRAAVRAGRSIVVTSDHGHTPYWGVDMKVRAPADASQRFCRGQAPAGAVTFPGTPWRAGTVHLLTDVGAYVSVQRSGYHGGAALEEVVVPIAVLSPEGQDAARPEWWSHADRQVSREPASPPIDSHSEILEPWHGHVPSALVPLIRFLDRHEQITEAEVARMADDRRAWRKLVRALAKLRTDGLLEFDWARNTHQGMGRIVKRATP